MDEQPQTTTGLSFAETPAARSSDDGSELQCQVRPKSTLNAWVASRPITSGLIAVNIGVFVVAVLAFRRLPSPEVVLRFDSWGAAMLSGQWWRLLTSMFFHAGVGHVLGNALELAVFGYYSEKIWGNRIFILFYLSCGLVGNVALLAFYPEWGGIGASGSIRGLVGAIIAVYGSRFFTLPKKAQWKLVALVALVIFAEWPTTSNSPPGQAMRSVSIPHIFGLLAGLLLAGLFQTRFFATAKCRYWAFAILALLLTTTVIVVRQHNRYIPIMYAAARDHDAGRTDQALEKIKVVLQMKPTNVTANRIASVLFVSKSDYPGAERAIRIVLADDKYAEYFVYLLGLVELRENRCKEAWALRQWLEREESRYAPMLGGDRCFEVAIGFAPAPEPSITRNPRFWFGNEYTWH